MSVNSPAHMRAFAMAMMATITFSIGALGGFSSGFVAQYKGYNFSFSLSAGLAIGAGLLIMILGRRLNFNKHKERQVEPGAVAVKSEVVSREAKLITLSLGGIGVLFFISMGINMTYLPLYANKIGISTSQIGILYGVRGILSTAIMMPIGKFCDRNDKWIILSIGLGVVALSMLTIAFAGNFPWLVVAMLLYALGSASLYTHDYFSDIPQHPGQLDRNGLWNIWIHGRYRVDDRSSDRRVALGIIQPTDALLHCLYCRSNCGPNGHVDKAQTW